MTEEQKRALNPAHLLDLKDSSTEKLDNNKVVWVLVLASIIVAHFAGKGFSTGQMIVLISGSFGVRMWSMFLRQQRWKVDVEDRFTSEHRAVSRRDPEAGIEPAP